MIKLSTIFSLQTMVIAVIVALAVIVGGLGVALITTGFPPFVIMGLVLIVTPLYIVGSLIYHARKG